LNLLKLYLQISITRGTRLIPDADGDTAYHHGVNAGISQALLEYLNGLVHGFHVPSAI